MHHLPSCHAQALTRSSSAALLPTLHDSRFPWQALQCLAVYFGILHKSTHRTSLNYFTFHACVMKAVQQSFSFYACYWHVVKTFCHGSVLKEMVCEIVSSMSVKSSGEITGKSACLLVFYYVNYLPFDQCVPSLRTLLVFCETKRIHQILKTKTKGEREFPPYG